MYSRSEHSSKMDFDANTAQHLSARSPSSDGKFTSGGGYFDNNWGFNAEGVSSYTGGAGSAWADLRDKRTDPRHPTPANPYIEMRRRRTGKS